MKKRFSVIMVFMFLAMLATACVDPGQPGGAQSGGAAPPSGQSPSEPASPPSSKPPANEAANDAKEKVQVNFVTNPVGSGYYTLAVGQSQLVNSKTHIDLIVQPTQGTRVNPQLVGAGEAQLSNITTDTGLNAFKGLDGFAPSPFMRIIQAGHSNVYAFVVKKEDNMNEITDLKGKRVLADYPGVSIIRQLAELEFEAYGMNLEKDTSGLAKAESPNDGLQDLVEGKVDAAMVSLGGGKILEAHSTKPIKVLPFDPAKADVIQAQMEGMSSEIAKKADNQWLDEDVPVIGSPSLFWAHENTDEDTVYTIVKTQVENHEELFSVHSNFKGWTPDRAVRKVPIPYHPGAIKYYKEAGLWPDDMDAWQEELMSSLK